MAESEALAVVQPAHLTVDQTALLQPGQRRQDLDQRPLGGQHQGVGGKRVAGHGRGAWPNTCCGCTDGKRCG